MTLKDQVAVVTGGSHGLGLAIGRHLAGLGASLALLARGGDSLQRAAGSLRTSQADVLEVPADVTRAGDVERAVQAVIERWGRLDILVLNAGTWKPGSVVDTSEADWDFLLDLNLKGAYLTMKYALPWMIAQHRGTVIGIDSLGGQVGQPGAAAYAASKWGLRGLLESAALELKPHRVRVSLVYPHNINSAGKTLPPGSADRDASLEPGDIASLIGWICAAPDHVSVGNVSIWPINAGIRSV